MSLSQSVVRGCIMKHVMCVGDNQALMVQLGCLKELHSVIKNSRGETLTAALACLRNLSIHKANEVSFLNSCSQWGNVIFKL